MKKIALSFILLTCILAGIYHSNFRQHQALESILESQSYTIPMVNSFTQVNPVPF
jgi:hypothetical protein